MSNGLHSVGTHACSYAYPSGLRSPFKYITDLGTCEPYRFLLSAEALSKRYLALGAGEEAASMEKALGIRVVRHITKKPAGDAADLEKHFR